jgi:hypothetical protein
MGLYVKTGISYKILCKSPSDHQVDFIFVDLYLLPSFTVHRELMTIRIMALFWRSLPIGIPGIIMGDFNVDLLRDSVALQSLSFSICERSHFNRSRIFLKTSIFLHRSIYLLAKQCMI